MASFTERVKALNLPEGQYVVIGSGLLDALGLRQAGDVGVAVSDALFEELKTNGQYELQTKYGSEVLLSGDVEIWKQWTGVLPFTTLIANTMSVGNVTFVKPEIIIEQKEARGLPKDLKDVQLLKEYLAR